jgi:hypothetical protein
MLIDRDCLSGAALAAYMGIETWAVQRWIKRGLLKAMPRHSIEDQYVVRIADVKVFLKTYPQHWNHVLADKFFLVDTLTFVPTNSQLERRVAP